MLDDMLRSTKDLLLAPIARWLSLLHPTVVTVIAFGLGVIAGLFIVQGQYALGLAFWLLNRLFDGLDGAVARLSHRQSDFGGYLDIVSDFAIYAWVPISIVMSRPSAEGYLALAFLLAMFYINAASWMYLAAILEKRKHGAEASGELTSVTMPAGIIGGAETVLFFSFFIILPQHFIWLFIAMGTLVAFTIVQRLIWAARYL